MLLTTTHVNSDVINVGKNITFTWLQLLMNLSFVNFIRHSNVNPEITYVPGVQSFAWDEVNCKTEVKIQIPAAFKGGKC